MSSLKTSPAVSLRFSSDIMWLNFIESVCSKCDKSTCSYKEANHCFEDWFS